MRGLKHLGLVLLPGMQRLELVGAMGRLAGAVVGSGAPLRSFQLDCRCAPLTPSLVQAVGSHFPGLVSLEILGLGSVRWVGKMM